MFLLTGPPGSGKTHQIFALFRDSLARDDAVLIVPTVTMADHLRHRLAREGLVFRPSRIQTLAAFVDAWAPEPRQASAATLRLALEDALAADAPPLFGPVAGMAGFQSSLADLIEELASAGCDARRLARISGDSAGDAVARVWSAVDARLRARGLASRADRLRIAAERLRGTGAGDVRTVLVDGFFDFSEPELDLLAAIRERCGLVVTLPRWEGSEQSAVRLRARGLVERDCAAVRPVAVRSRFIAATPAQEAEEIARRMLDERARGRPWREMGVVMRRRAPYAAILAAAFDRFGIPARLYFAEPLEASALVRSRLAATAAMSGEPLSGPEWIARCAEPRPENPRPRDEAALEAFEAAVRETASACGAHERIPPARFAARLRTVVGLSPLRTPDRRRDVVHVMDVHESRQWDLPVVFVCGLYEGGFPAGHGQHPILGDDARRRLREHGVVVRASDERRREEEFLFEIATSRATGSLVLSHPIRDATGAETAESSLLAGEAAPVGRALYVRPRPLSLVMAPRTPAIYSEELRAAVARRNETVSSSSIESFLQCPFQFFARRTLGLREPEQPLGALAQGSIFHAVLAALPKAPLLAESVLEGVFEEHCREKQVANGWRKESVRRELLRSLRAFLADAEHPLRPDSITEQSFEIPIADGIAMRGKIDRIDLDSSGRAEVIDYKYSPRTRLSQLMRSHREGAAVQAGLYALATRAALHHPVRSVLFATVRGAAHWDGWRGGEIDGLVQASRERVIEAVEAIRSGRIAPDPADAGKCVYCAYRDTCRVESGGKKAAAGRP